MMLFWITTIVLILVGLLFFVVPIYYGKAQDDAASRDELNKAFYQDRVREIESESDEGIVATKGELVSELQQSLLDDVVELHQPEEKLTSPWLVLPGIVATIVICYGLYFNVGNISKVDEWQKVAARLPELSQRLMNEDQDPLTDEEMNDLTLALRTRLHDTPNDATGWLLLGRIGMANRDAETSQTAMKRAYDLRPNDTEVQLGYAQTLMMIGDPAQSDFVRSLLRSVIKRDHTNVRAMSLLAFDAFERKEFKLAISYWSMMKKLVSPDDPRVEMLDRSIERAQAQLGTGEATTKSLTVTINLDPSVQLPQQGLLIISAHDENGSPMPIAARRVPLSGQFPLTVMLDDNDSMIPERLMSSLPKLMVKARIDADGNVMTKQGDWYGESQPVDLGSSVNVVINQQYK
ncbi:c-type cytochrome biogenesis protein CcmI [Photobacterium jeanii]|uniref:C-type cytochrome biogenesis protein CcmI n=1 Tax=Photobacterium jeanii TaxID=858640 RepID=A0A178KN07_9GAMM|nr:c-type cytochrome biogenesis protein CcmI [Photobacterium jeanii]OAN18580.1 c-type cytochrome biogenesis protein CcmI [Photobacterium jeanii]PST91739.1 c-type cytochrome biogenesis protein CcmI [Photobacterium jeanii]